MKDDNELQLLKEIRDYLKNPTHDIEILKVNDISRILKINRNQASNLFKRPDFPALCDCGDNKIEKNAFYNWLQNRHAENDKDEIEPK